MATKTHWKKQKQQQQQQQRRHILKSCRPSTSISHRYYYLCPVRDDRRSVILALTKGEIYPCSFLELRMKQAEEVVVVVAVICVTCTHEYS